MRSHVVSGLVGSPAKQTNLPTDSGHSTGVDRFVLACGDSVQVKGFAVWWTGFEIGGLEKLGTNQPPLFNDVSHAVVALLTTIYGCLISLPVKSLPDLFVTESEAVTKLEIV